VNVTIPVVPSGAPPSNSRRTWLVPLLGIVGVALLVFLIARLGPARIIAELAHLRSVLPAVLAITSVKYVLQAAGWRLVLPKRERPRWGESILATITGDALGYLTWAGPFTGEPVRALLIRDQVPVAAGLAAGAAERVMYNLSAAVLVLIVLLILLADLHPVWSAIAFAVSAYGAMRFVRIARRDPERSLYAGRHEAPPGAAAGTADRRPNRHFGRVIDAARLLWIERRGVLPALALLCFAQHAVLVIEARILLGALGGEASVWEAFVFEAVTKIVNTAGMLVPARIGVSEGGSALLADALGFAASHGLSLALMRRARALSWAAVGLALMPLQERRARRAGSR
jgi:hypothetical protein